MKKLITVLICSILLVCACLVLTACTDFMTDPPEEEIVGRIQNLTYDGEKIVWDSVDGAQNYKIVVNGTEHTVSPSNGKIAFPYDAKGTDFDFSVVAIVEEGNENNPTYSHTFRYLGKVEDVRVQNGVLTWTSLENADQYEIKYNGDVVASSVGTTSYTLKPGSFSCSIRAKRAEAGVADGNNPYYSVWSDKVEGELLTSPANISYDGESITWQKVEKADSYVLKLGNEEYSTSTNSFAYPAGTQDFSISVRAVGDEKNGSYGSVYSEPKTYTYIQPVDVLHVEDGVLKWTNSENAVRYQIKINDIMLEEELTKNEYSGLRSGVSYRIRIKPIGSGDFYFSRWSQEMTVTLLRSPVVSYGDGVIRWNQVTGSAGYSVKIVKDGDTVHTSAVGEETFVYNYAFQEVGEYFVYVKATVLGGNGIYESKYSNPYSVKRLASPTHAQVINMPLEPNQVAVNFTPAVGASAHVLLADGVEVASARTGASSFSVDLSQMTHRTQEASVKFQIYARGSVSDAGAILDTLVPLEISVLRLAVPQNVTINGRQLMWDSVNHTSKYVITIDGNRIEVTTTSFTFTDLAYGAHNITVQAMGNGEDVITSSFSDVVKIQKLKTPAGLSISGGLLRWEAVSDATAYKVLLGDQAFNADTTSFNLAGYETYISEGVGTQISVYAIGNGSNIVDSDVSATKTVSKYNRPSQIKVNGDNLVWNPSTVNSVNCNQYKLLISKDGAPAIEVYTTSTSYPLSNLDAGSYTIAVVAIGDLIHTIDSPASMEYSFTKLAKVSGVKREGSMYTWDPVAGATGYEIKLSKDAAFVTIKTNSYTPTYTSGGVYEVSIRAISDQVGYVDSDVLSFSQTVTRLTEPQEQAEMTNSNAFKVEKSGNVITVTIKKQDGATGYEMFVGALKTGTPVSETETEIVYSFTMTTAGAEYGVQVRILGRVFAEDGTYVLDSNKSTVVKVLNTND